MKKGGRINGELSIYDECGRCCKRTELFQIGTIDRIINLRRENEALQNENKSLREKLEQAYDFMQQFVLGGRNLLDMFKEQIGEMIGWVQDKVGGRSR